MTGGPWLSAYPEGVPATIDPDRYASLNDLLRQSFERYGDLPALENFGVSMTFAEFDTASRHLAAFLRSRDELQQGDRVAVMLPNLIQYPVVIAGLLRAGLTIVNVNPLYKPRELEHQLRDSGARAIFVLENFASTVAEVLDDVPLELVIVSELGDHFPPLKRLVTNFVVKLVKRLVPPWRIPHVVRYLVALGAGRELP